MDMMREKEDWEEIKGRKKIREYEKVKANMDERKNSRYR